MVAYAIDTAAVLAVLQDTEAELAPLASLASDLQDSVDTVASSLASSPVGRALAQYAAETLLRDLASAVAGSGRAVQSVKAAVAGYAAADQEMRMHAEAAAAAVPGIIGKPLPGPPPWKPIWPQKPLPVLPNPLLKLPYRLIGPPWLMGPPRWMRPPGWMGPPRWMRPPWIPGLPRWPHATACPGPHRPPGGGCLPPPDCYYPLQPPATVPPPDSALPHTDLPVGRMLTTQQTMSRTTALTSHQVLTRVHLPAAAGAGSGSLNWGLT